MPALSSLSQRLSGIASNRLTIPLLCVGAFLLRVIVAFAAPDHFWSYTSYYFLANTLAHGGGYCMEPGRLCAFFPPVFPTVVAAAVLVGHVKAGVGVLASLAGTGTVWLTWRMGKLLFSPVTGLLAAAYAALYPYYVWHDSVLQENATLAFVVALSIWLMLRLQRSQSRILAMVTGMMLAIAVLTKANLSAYLPLALLWTAFALPGTWRKRAQVVLSLTFGMTLLLVPWFVRTWRITGAPIIYSNGGFSLWTANHRLTFDYFPQRSIDAAQEAEWLDVPPAERHEMYELGDPQFIRETQWFWNRGMAFIRANPTLTARRAVYKIWIAFSPAFSPAQGIAFQSVYLISYLPLFVLAPLGMWRSRRAWRLHGCIYLLFTSFAVSCAVFWGHTSHRMYLEPYLMIFAASTLSGRTNDCDSANAFR